MGASSPRAITVDTPVTPRASTFAWTKESTLAVRRAASGRWA
jgi:hypothetical protein